MTEILLNGYLGKMGRVITAAINERSDCKIVAGVDYTVTDEAFPFPVFRGYDDVNILPDVIVDFSNPAALDGILKFALAKNIPAVICTTGLTETQIDEINAASEIVPIFFSANMSIGVNLICELAKKAASVLYPQYNIEIIEQHHNQKVDAPSGTALMIANEISSVLPEKIDYEYNRQPKREKRPVAEIGIHSIRGGTIVGEHEIIFAGKDETVKLSHTAMSKEIFATGAINAAVFLKDKKPGLYTMKEMLS